MARMHAEMSPVTKALLKVIRPLTDKERRNAIAAAVKYLSEELSQRYQIFPVELRIEKPSQPDAAPKRTTAVLIFDYENRRTIEVVIDAQAKPVSKTDLTGFQPVFLDGEILRARELAERDERVAQVVSVPGMFASAFGPHPNREPGARLVGLRYAAVDEQRDVRLLGEAVVNLSTETLISFNDVQREEGH